MAEKCSALLRHFVYGVEKRSEVLLGVYIFLAVGGKKNILSLFKPEAGVDIRSLYIFKIGMQHLRHW